MAANPLSLPSVLRALRAGTLVLAVLAGVLGVRPVLAAQECALRPVPGIGMACPEEGAWRVHLSTGGTVLTHGHDYLFPRFAGTIAPIQPSCATDARTQVHNVLVYAHASDQPNLYTARLAPMRTAAAMANAMLRREAGEHGRTLDYRFLCANGILVVYDAPLLVRQQDVTLDTLIVGMRALGFASPMAKYWIYYDGKPPGTAAGVATLESDDRLAADNANNFGPSYAVTWGGPLDETGASVMMHESAHTMGAVQSGAPHSTGAGHCTDGRDLMCYADGGPKAGAYSESSCATVKFDCNRDDYFHPNPPGSSWLAKHWNLASPLNRFVAGCLYATGLFAAGAGSAGVDDVTARTHAVPSSCHGRPYALSAFVPQQAGVVPFVAAAASGGALPDANVCFFAGATRLRCDENLGAEAGTIPAGTTSARVVLNAGAAAAYVLSAI